MPTCTPGYGASSYTDASRGSSTLVWSSPENASVGSPTATDSGFLPGLSSHWLSGASFVPMPPLPAGSTLSSLTLYVRHRLTSMGPNPTPVTLSQANSGTLNVAPNRSVPADFENFAIDLTPLAPTVAAVNAGLNARIAYDGPQSAPYDPANWSVNNDPTTPQNGIRPDGSGPYGASTTFHAILTWIGTGPAPATVLVAVRSVSQVSGPYNVPGNVTLDNGQGTVVSGTIQNPPLTHPGPADGTVVYSVPVSGGVATKAITISRSNSGNPSNNGDYAPGNVFATVVSPDASTVEVESMYLVACYNGATPPPPALVVPVRPNLSRIPPLRPLTPTIR